MLFLKQPLMLPFLWHNSETTCQIDSNKVSNCKLKLVLCSSVKPEIIDIDRGLYKNSDLTWLEVDINEHILKEEIMN